MTGRATCESVRRKNAPDPERVIFTRNCTDALNLVLEGLIKAGDWVVVGPYEHNPVTRPLYCTVVNGGNSFGSA